MFVNKTVTLVSDEAAFIKAFIGSITAEDSRITCDRTDSDIDEMFKATEGTPSFTLNIGDSGRIQFERSSSNGYCDSYKLKASVNGITTSDEGYLYYCSSSAYSDNVTRRTWRYVVAGNDNAILVMLGKYDKSTFDVCRGSMMQVTSEDKSVTACGYLCYNSDNCMPVLSQPLYITNGKDKNMAVQLNTDRLLYSRQGGAVEVIKNKVMLQGDVAKAECGGLWDCTTVPAYTTLTIDGKLYYTVNRHTLLLCD